MSKFFLDEQGTLVDEVDDDAVPFPVNSLRRRNTVALRR